MALMTAYSGDILVRDMGAGSAKDRWERESNPGHRQRIKHNATDAD